MGEQRLIYILCKDERDSVIEDFKKNINESLYDRMEIVHFSDFNKDNLPEDNAIVILEVSKETIDEVLAFYNLILIKSEYLLIFLFRGNEETLLGELSEISHFASIFPPYTRLKIEYQIKNAVHRFMLEKHYDDKMKKFIKEHGENKNKLRELDSIFSIYRLVDLERDLDNLFVNSLPIISRAFNPDSKISIRISFMDREYKTENFKTSSREFSDKLIDQDGFRGDLVIYINDEDLEKFPITIEELNTFSTIRSLLSRALERIVYEEMKKMNFDYTMTIINLFRSFTNNQFSNLEEIFKETIVKFKGLFFPDYCFIITYQKTDMSKCRFYTLKHLDDIIKEEILTLLNRDFNSSLIDKNNQTRFLDYDLNSYTIIPFLQNSKIPGFLIMCFSGENELTRYFQYSLFNMVSEYLSLATTSLENLNSIKSYKQAIEQSPSSIVITDLKGNIQYVNPHFEKVTGYSFQEISGKNPSILKSGRQDEAFYADLWRKISRGNKWYGNFENKCKDGSIIWESASISPIIDNSGKQFAYIAIKEDITKKVLAEEKMRSMNEKLISTQSSLVKEEKLASIGRLAAGVAHELNNPIGFINSNFRSMKRYLEKFRELFEHEDFHLSESLKELYQTEYLFEDIRAILDESDEGFKRIINIINSLRSFSRIDESKTSSFVDFNELIKTTLIVARNEIKYNANIHHNFGDIPGIYCHVGEINQVLLNLIVNASQAISGNGSDTLGNIYISTESADGKIICRIRDDGPGIRNEDKLKIFDPFYTTKPVGKGTGLGLSISYDIIVNKHGGALYLGSPEEGGAEFVIELPIGEPNE